MVVQGRGRLRKDAGGDEGDRRSPPTARVGKIAALARYSTRKQALDILHELAALVAPVIDHYKFNVGVLCEMYPRRANLLGLNVNGGAKICLRLRSASNDAWFLSRDEVLGTLFHELAHNKIGPHNAAFHALVEELKDKFYELELKRSGQVSMGGVRVYAPVGRPVQSQNSPSTSSEKKAAKSGTRLGSNKVANSSKITKGTPLGTNHGTTNGSLRDLMVAALNRRLPEMASVSCSQHEGEPDDDELTVIEIICLDSEEEEEGAKEGKEAIDPPQVSSEVIIID